MSKHELPQMAILLRIEKLRISNGLLLSKLNRHSSETCMLTKYNFMHRSLAGGNVDFDQMSYSGIFVINGLELNGERNISKNTVNIPYTDEPDIGIGDVIIQKTGSRYIELKVIDVDFQVGGTLGIGTSHSNLLRLKIANMTAQQHTSSNSSPIFHIGSVSGEQVQLGNNNSQVVTISLQNLVEAVAKNGDAEAKLTLRKLLENSTVASVLGAGAAALLNLL